jgi:hypothetical protein
VAGEGYQVDRTELGTHAGSVDRIGDAVGQARDAGSTVTLGGDAYGKLCGWVPGLLAPFQQSCVDALAAAEEQLHDSASRLRGTGQTYGDVEDASAAQFPGGSW